MPERHTGWPNRVALHLPPVLLDQPWGIFIKFLCIVSGLATFVGPRPGSLEATLPQALVFLWSFTLVLGASFALWGLLRPKVWRLEVAGLIWLGTASIVYGVAILANAGFKGAVPGCIILGFGLAALVRSLAVYVTYEVAREAAGR
jgi:hypothetical protein